MHDPPLCNTNQGTRNHQCSEFGSKMSVHFDTKMPPFWCSSLCKHLRLLGGFLQRFQGQKQWSSEKRDYIAWQNDYNWKWQERQINIQLTHGKTIRNKRRMQRKENITKIIKKIQSWCSKFTLWYYWQLWCSRRGHLFMKATFSLGTISSTWHKN